MNKVSLDFTRDIYPPVRTYIDLFISEEDILYNNPEAEIHEIVKEEICDALCTCELSEEIDQGYAINYNTQVMAEAFTQEKMKLFSLRAYRGNVGCYSLIVNNVYMVRAVILPENFYYQRLHLWARGTIDMSKVIILVDSSLENTQLELKALRTFYRNRIDPILKECGADVWVVPPGFIHEYTAVPKLKLPSDIMEFAKATNAILETAREVVAGGSPQEGTPPEGTVTEVPLARLVQTSAQELEGDMDDLLDELEGAREVVLQEGRQTVSFDTDAVGARRSIIINTGAGGMAATQESHRDALVSREDALVSVSQEFVSIQPGDTSPYRNAEIVYNSTQLPGVDGQTFTVNLDASLMWGNNPPPENVTGIWEQMSNRTETPSQPEQVPSSVQPSE